MDDRHCQPLGAGPLRRSLTRGSAFLGAVALATAALWAAVPDHAAARTPRGVDNLTAVGDLLFFTAEDGIHGDELWVSDGTTAGTVMVEDIRPGPAGSTPFDLAVAGDTLYFNANDGTHGGELWKSDGTAGGTDLVKDVNEGSGSGFLSGNGPDYTAIDDTVYFAAYEPVNGAELWKSDGTEVGTSIVKDIRPGGHAVPEHLVAAGDTLFFSANVGGSVGRELWKSDGTETGTTLVKDFWPGFAISGVANSGIEPTSTLSAFGDDVLLTARDGIVGRELWSSDGTEAGTALVKDVNPGAADAFPFSLPPLPAQLTAVGGVAFFTPLVAGIGAELWVTDGTEAGTVLVKDIRTGASSSNPRSLIDAYGVLGFQADDGSNGRELWKSDGTAGGTTMVKDVNPAGDGLSSGSSIGLLDGVALFGANDGTTGTELWVSAGSAANTLLVEDINPSGASNPRQITSVGSAGGELAFFVADDGTTGDELWKSDGTAAGTMLVKEIVPPAGPYVTVKFSGKVKYANEGFLTSGGFTTSVDNQGRLTRIAGTGTIRAAAGPGDATVAISVNRTDFFFLRIYVGNVRVIDPSQGLNLSTLQLFGSVSGNQFAASGNTQWFVFDAAGLGSYRLNWSVD